TGFSKTDHPIRTFKNKKEFTANASKTCTMCHTETQLKKKPIHGEIIASKVTTCIECHGSHSIKRMSELKPLVKENQHCLTCHKHKLSMSLKSGESLSLSVDESVIRKSVHNKLQCSACHIGFSKTEHPKRVFESKRNYSLSASEVCKKCHENANKLYEESIHLAQLKSGNLKSSTCTDCHGSHSMIKVTTDKMLGLLSCNKCHGEINNAYKTSAHGEALTKAKENAPTCSSCHNAHDIKVTARTTKMKDTCLKCHKDAEALHKKWLSNPPITLSSFAALHFDVITCTTCHAVPNAGRGIYLSLYDKKTGKPFPEEEVLKLLGTDSSGLVKKIDTNGDGGIDARELWNITQQLNGKGANVTFIGRMDVQKGAEAHQIAAKTKAVKDCEQCHRADSSYFKNVSIVLFKADGRPTLYTAQQGVLNSLFSVLPVNQFYALGSSNIKLLDILFILAVVGGLCVPIGHITLRIVTKPLRHLRKMGKGGKK
ncbi:MAG: cytochrome c3 family protein, partial [Nitrospirota bacterium]|nr:cytochrome c3 family protein [Nitrospirota bacterium]